MRYLAILVFLALVLGGETAFGETVCGIPDISVSRGEYVVPDDTVTENYFYEENGEQIFYRQRLTYKHKVNSNWSVDEFTIFGEVVARAFIFGDKKFFQIEHNGIWHNVCDSKVEGILLRNEKGMVTGTTFRASAENGTAISRTVHKK